MPTFIHLPDSFSLQTLQVQREQLFSGSGTSPPFDHNLKALTTELSTAPRLLNLTSIQSDLYI